MLDMNKHDITALVLGGGPGAERDVSIAGANAVAAALAAAGFRVEKRIIERITAADLAAMPGDVVFPVLHGAWGEGGPMQDMLAADGRPFVGSGPAPARLAMDKIALKLIAQSLGIVTAVAAVLDADDPVCPLQLPVVVKPVREGSTVGLHVCRTPAEWDKARRDSARSGRVCMVEPLIAGRELTVGVIGDEALPIIEIVPADGLYDYDAKYARDDTSYIINPRLPAGAAEVVRDAALRLMRGVGAWHIGRADFILDETGTPWLLELNTMPGFTDHSLVPMAARARPGGAWDMPELCARLVTLAIEDGAGGRSAPRRGTETQHA